MVPCVAGQDLPDGLVLELVTGDGGQVQQRLVRREGGRPDLRFGHAGAASLTGLHAQVVATDARGRVLVAGQRQVDGRPAVRRYTPNGQPDATWGQAGEVTGPGWPPGAISHLLPLGDGRLLLAGTRRARLNEQAMLWSVEADGQVQAPALALTEVPSSRVVSLLAGAGASVMIGLRVGRPARASLEVHLVVPQRHGTALPEPVGRQPVPPGDTTAWDLQRREGGFRWADAGRPDLPGRRMIGLDEFETSGWRAVQADDGIGAEADASGPAVGSSSLPQADSEGSAILPPLAQVGEPAEQAPIRFQPYVPPWWERLPAGALWALAATVVATLALLLRRRTGGC